MVKWLRAEMEHILQCSLGGGKVRPVSYPRYERNNQEGLFLWRPQYQWPLGPCSQVGGATTWRGCRLVKLWSGKGLLCNSCALHCDYEENSRERIFFSPSPKLEFEDNLFTVRLGVENSNSLLYLTFLCIISQRKLHGRFFVAIIDL